MDLPAEESCTIPLARLPGSSAPLSSEEKLEDSEFYKNVVTASPREVNRSTRMLSRAHIYSFLNNVFPYYLPNRYHAMDCVALCENSSELGVVMNSMFFVLGSYIHKDMTQTIVQYANYNNISNDNPLLLSDKLRAVFFKITPIEQCQSAEDFLLEPWVLAQLPYQPAILHQWLLVAYAEVLKIYKEIAHLHCLPQTRGKFEELMLLVKKHVCKLYNAVVNGFKLLESLISSFRPHLSNSQVKEYYLEILDCIPFLKFIFNNNAHNIIRAAKRSLWNGTRDQSCYLRTVEGQTRCERLVTFLYSPTKLWEQANFSYYFTGFGFPADNLEPKTKFTVQEKAKKKYSKDANWNMIKLFVREKILKPGWIKGVKKSDVLDLVDGDLEILYYYTKYMKYADMSSSSSKMTYSNAGVLCNIFVLQADFKVTECLAEITAQLHFKLEEKSPNKVVLQAVDCEGPDISFRQINIAMRGLRNKWTVDTLLTKLNNQICIPGQPKVDAVGDGELCSDMDAKKLNDVACKMERRIKVVVFNIFKKYVESLDADQLSECYEAPLVQYLLPCFVSSFLRMAKNPAIDFEDKKRYFSFVHLLIKSFEDSKGLFSFRTHPLKYQLPAYHLICEKYVSNKFRISMPSSIFYYNQIVLHRKVEEGENSADPFINGICAVLPRLIACLFQGGTSIGSTVGRDFFIFSFTHQSWLSWVSRLFGRIRFALRGEIGTKSTVVQKLTKAFSLGELILTMFTVYDANTDYKVLETYKETNIELRSALQIMRMFVVLGYYDDSMPFAELLDFVTTMTDNLSTQQILSITMYHLVHLKDLQKHALTESEKKRIIAPLHLDEVEVAFHALVFNDRWKLKQIVSEWLNDDEGKGDTSLATLELAKLAPKCFHHALADLTEDGKVRMDHPGQITFFPIKHCRWCGLVTENEMKMCEVCARSPEYPDKNYFCSQKCEAEAMDTLHSEEHASCLVLLLKIDD